MNYPLISEYVEAIKAAEDNFEQLKQLRPVLGIDGEPVMSSGNFAVVFKMKDEQTGRLHAVKCFLKEQEGRAEAYRLIAEELEYVNSTFLTPIKYLDKELFVDTSQTDETEFPVLLMDWVEGTTLDKYVRAHLDDEYELSLLAYQFSRLAMWLMPQPFAHGDLKPDNILVRDDGTLALVDYDGMYVPAMKGQRARELGSPDFRHPSRTETDFDEHIDDFSLASILLSLKAISLHPELLEEYGASDRLLFSEKDYRNLSESKVMDALKSLMQVPELASLYSLFILAASQNNLSQVSFRLFNLTRPEKPQNEEDNLSTEVTVGDLANAWIDEFGVKYSADKKRLLRIPDDIIDYRIRKGTQVICDEALKMAFRGEQIKNRIKSLYIPESVKIISSESLVLAVFPELCQIVVDEKNIIFDSRNQCNAIIKTQTNELLFGCQSTVIPKDISIIAYKAFYGCVGLTSIAIPKSVTSIENLAFAFCRNLTSITIPENVMNIGKKAFFFCDGLTSIIVDKKNGTYDSRKKCNAIIETISNTLIRGCRNTIITNDVTTIGNRAFVGCESLTKISIPKSVTSIEDFAFAFCRSLTSITLPDSVMYIGKNVFLDCSSLTSIIIPKGKRKKFEELLPDYKDKLVEQEEVEDLNTEVTDDNLANAWEDEFGVYYSTDGKRLLGATTIVERIKKTLEIKSQENNKKSNLPIINWDDDVYYKYSPKTQVRVVVEMFNSPENYFIRKGTKYICDEAFQNDVGLASIVIPDSVTSIGDYAFCGCDRLTSIVIPDSVKSIGNRAFNRCYGLTSIVIPDSVKSIGNGAFDGCDGLTSIAIPNSVTSIGEGTFRDCSGLTSIVIPDSVTSIGKSTFFGCGGLTSIVIPDSVTSIGKSTFFGCGGLTSIVIPESVSSIGEEAFSGCKGLTSILVNKNNQYYDSRCNCNAIIETKSNTLIAGCSSTIIPDSVTSIGDYAFYGCDRLTSIVIPDSVKSIGEGAFSWCRGLTSIVIPESVSSIGEEAFKGCKGLTSILVNKNNQYYDSRCNCNAIIKTKSNTMIAGCHTTFIPDSVTSIGDYAFCGCDRLTSIVIPDSVKSIGNRAFDGCDGLTSIAIPNSVTSICNNAFGYTLKTIIIPKGTRRKFELIFSFHKDKLIEQ